MLHDHEAAEDAVQEAAFKAWRKLSHLREGHEPRPWFLGIVANECSRLDMNKRLVLVLHWYLDLPLDEISVITGISVHAVEGRLLRGMNELRRRMEGRDEN